MSALYPGYTHVQSLSTNHEDEEWEEIEEEYITIDLGSLAEPGLLFAEASSSGFRIVVCRFHAVHFALFLKIVFVKGLDTPTPFIQLAGTVFKGRVDALLGSEMLFEDGKAGAFV